MSLSIKNYVTLKDLTPGDMNLILDLAQKYKAERKKGQISDELAGKTLAMIFGKPSTRTRISFETAMTELGGHAQFMTESDMQTANKEKWIDTAKVLDRYVHAVLIRMYSLPEKDAGTKIVRLLADETGIPVINGLDDTEHPCQITADLLTFKELLKEELTSSKIVISWAYSDRVKSPGVPNSMVIGAALSGLNLTFACPPGYELTGDYMDKARLIAKDTGAQINVSHDIFDACQGARVIYAKSWGSNTMAKEEDEQYRKQYKKDWCISDRHFAVADKRAVFMHCLPADRGQEVTDEVIDGPMSIVYDQAENRLHAQKAILRLLMK